MSGVRPFVKDTDLAQVAELNRTVFGSSDPAVPWRLDSYLSHFDAVFLNNPWRDAALPSLVYEDRDGEIRGFLGVVPRPMVRNGEPLRVAISSQFMVHPRARGRAGWQLLKEFFSGPQDMSITEGSNSARTIWEGLGGTTSLLYSVRWTRPLRPGRYVLSFLKQHGVRLSAALALTPFCLAANRLLARLAPPPLRPAWPVASAGELSESELLACLSNASRGSALRPEYDETSVKWLCEILAEKKGRGQFRKILVRDAADQALGWYLYYLKPAGMSEVVQLGAKKGSLSAVVRHLLHDAWRQGAVAVSGRLDPGSIQALLGERCLMHVGDGSWTLVHSRRHELLEPLYRGDAFLTRLEGEWWAAL